MEDQCTIDLTETGRNVFMRITHNKTGVSVTGTDTFRLRLRKRLLAELADKIKQRGDTWQIAQT